MKYREMLWEGYSQTKAQEVTLAAVNLRVDELLIESACGMEVSDLLSEATNIQRRETTYFIRTTIEKIHTFIVEFVRRAKTFIGKIVKYIEAQINKAYMNDRSSGKNKSFMNMTIKDYHGYDINRIGAYIGSAENTLRAYARNFDGMTREAEQMIDEISRGNPSEDLNARIDNFGETVDKDRSDMLNDLGFNTDNSEWGSKYWDRFDSKFSRYYPAKERWPVGNALKEYGIDKYDSKKALIEYVRNLERQIDKLNHFDKAVSEATGEIAKLDEKLGAAIARGTEVDSATVKGSRRIDDADYAVTQSRMVNKAYNVIRQSMQRYISDLNGMTHFMIQTVHKAVTEACTVASCKSHSIFEAMQ